MSPGHLSRWMFVLLAVLPTSAHVRASDGVLSLEECYGPYRIQPYIKLAAGLQAMPKDERIDQLWEWAGPGYVYPYSEDYPHEQIYILCELLFQPRHADESLAPQMRGSPSFIGDSITDPEKLDERERDPMFWVGDIPFRLLRGYGYAGMRIPARVYLDYCIRNADWTTRDFAAVDLSLLSAAYERLMELEPWSRPLNESERRFLADQLKPYEPPPLGPPGIFAVMKGFNHHTVIGKQVDGRPLVLAEDEHIEINVGGGKRPYRYVLTVSTAVEPEPKVVDEGVGSTSIPDPFRRETLAPDWPDCAAGDELVFRVTDASGQGHELYFRVMEPGTFLISRKPAAVKVE